MLLIDSDVLIAHLRGDERATVWLAEARRIHGQLAMSALSVAEITGGMRSGERSSVWRLFARMRTEPVTDLVARRAGELARRYRRSHSGIGLADYLIAATVDLRGYELGTLNVRHYPMLPNLEPAFALGPES